MNNDSGHINSYSHPLYCFGNTLQSQKKIKRFFLLLLFSILIFSSVKGTAQTLQNGVPFNTSLSAGLYAAIEFVVPDNAAKLTVSLTNGSGDLDLYLKYGAPVSGNTVSAIDADTDHISDGPTADERITLTPSSVPPLKAGRWYVTTLNYNNSNTSFTITASVEVEEVVSYDPEPRPVLTPDPVSFTTGSVYDIEDADYIFNWAENELPGIFPSHQSTELETGSWYVHYYQSNGNALGLNTDDNEVYYYNGASSDLVKVGNVNDVKDLVISCGRSSKETASIGNITLSSDAKVNADNYNKAVENYAYAAEKMMQNIQAAFKEITANYTKNITVDSITTDEINTFNNRLNSTIPCMAETLLYNRDVVRLQNVLRPANTKSEKRSFVGILVGAAVLGITAIKANNEILRRLQDADKEAITNAPPGSDTLKKYAAVVKLPADASRAEVLNTFNKLDTEKRATASREIGWILDDLATSNTDESEKAAELVRKRKIGFVKLAKELAGEGVKFVANGISAVYGSAVSKAAELFGASENLADAVDLTVSVAGLDPNSLIANSVTANPAAANSSKTNSVTIQGISKDTGQFTIPKPPKDVSQKESLEDVNEISQGNIDNIAIEDWAAMSYLLLQEILGQTSPSSTLNADGSMTATLPSKNYIINIRDVKNGDRIKVMSGDDFDLIVSISDVFPMFFENINLTNKGYVLNLELDPIFGEDDSNTSSSSDTLDSTSCPKFYDRSLDPNLGTENYTQWVYKLNASDTDGDGLFDNYLHCNYSVLDDKPLQYHATYVNNERNGWTISYYYHATDFFKSSERWYEDGQLNGPYRQFHYPSGELKSETYMSDGEKNGTSKVFSISGILLTCIVYIDGKYDRGCMP